MASFSRLQLAAALLEYDNDPDNPDAPRRNAQESAIFSHLRRMPRVPRGGAADDEVDPPRRSTDYLGVNLPGEVEGSIRRSTVGDFRRSTVFSVSPGEVTPQEEVGEKGSEVLSSWGLDNFAAKEVDPSSTKLEKSEYTRGRSMSEHLPNPFERPSTAESSDAPRRRSSVKRPFSMGDMDGLVISSAPERSVIPPKAIEYRRSMGANIDFASHQPGDRSSKILSSPLQIPFPATTTPSAEEIDNPFALPPPSEPSRLSRFDPKALAHERKLSQGSLNSRMILDNAAGPRSRTKSSASLGTRAMLDDVDLNEPQRPPLENRRPSRLDLLRPKVLVMPSPLQDLLPRNESKLRDGFFDTTDGRPLPPGSRPLARPGIRPLSGVNGASINPRLSMSLSQLTFRQTLMVGGERDVSFIDLDKSVRRANEDGQQIAKDWEEEEEEEEGLRPAGKLYGKSLMDDLENRKAAIKGKQRVFTGDDRPSMMQRGPLKRSSTLIDPESLKPRPNTQYMTPDQVQEDIRRKRASGAPLLDFEPPPPEGGVGSTRSVFGVDKIWERELAKLKAAEEAEKADKAKLDALDARIAKRKSMSKPAANKASKNASLAPKLPVPVTGSPLKPPVEPRLHDSDSEEELGVGSKRESTYTLGARGWFAGSDEDDEGHRPSPATSRMPSFKRKVAAAASSLPQITALNNSESESDEDIPLAEQLARKNYRPPPRLAGLQRQDETDSEDDKPIAALREKKSAPPTRLGSGGSTDLATFSSMLPSFGNSKTVDAGGSTNKKDEETSEDEVPLGVKHPDASNRLSGMPLGPNGRRIGDDDDDEDDDDKPLGTRFPGQSVYGLPQMQQAQLQQQIMLQQQMMMQQAQMGGSMGFPGMGMMGGSVMGSGFVSPFGELGTNLSMASLVGPQAFVQQQQQQQQISRVDKWRRDVAS